MNKKRSEGIIAPVIIASLIVLLDVAVVVAGVFILRSFLPEYAGLGTFLLVVATVMISSVLAIYVLRARIKEIRSGQEDDLSKY